MCMNECGSERAYDNIAVGAFENKFKKKPLPSLSSRNQRSLFGDSRGKAKE